MPHLVLLAGCPAQSEHDAAPPAPPDATVAATADGPGAPEPVLAPLDVTDDEIRAADGAVLLRMHDVPARIRVDGDTEFGASGRFTAAEMAPDGRWLAVVTTGAAHAGGWLVRVETREPRPAASQYGGDLRIGPWSGDGRYVVFVQEGPAPGRTISVVDREALGPTVEASAIPVRVPAHDELPNEAAYEPLEWRNGWLIFEVDGARHRFRPRTGETAPADWRRAAGGTGPAGAQRMGAGTATVRGGSGVLG